MSALRRVCVFCGSSMGVRPIHAEAAAALGRLLGERGLGLVYGGGNVGLMGVVAQAAAEAGAEVTGIIPQALVDIEGLGHVAHARMHIVGSMHERKAMMAELADCFVALPGGIGTLEEVFEVWTWGQLGLHPKPLGFLDVGAYYAHLHAFLDHMVAEGFLRERHRAMAQVAENPAKLLEMLENYQPPQMVRIIDKDTA